MEDNTKDLGDLEVYEIDYHIAPTISEENLQAELAKIHEVLSNSEVSIIGEGNPQMRQLAYEMTKKVDTKNFKFNKAFFGWIKFETEKSKIAEIKNGINSISSIIRFIILKTIKTNIAPIPKFSFYKKDVDAETEQNKKREVREMDEKEIDKSIDELVVEEKV